MSRAETSTTNYLSRGLEGRSTRAKRPSRAARLFFLTCSLVPKRSFDGSQGVEEEDESVMMRLEAITTDDGDDGKRFSTHSPSRRVAHPLSSSGRNRNRGRRRAKAAEASPSLPRSSSRPHHHCKRRAAVANAKRYCLVIAEVMVQDVGLSPANYKNEKSSTIGKSRRKMVVKIVRAHATGGIIA